MKDNDTKLLEEAYVNSKTVTEATGQKIFIVQREIQYEGTYLIGVSETLEGAKALKQKFHDDRQGDYISGYEDTVIYQVPFDVEFSFNMSKYEVKDEVNNER